ncbi:hypothetical protein C5167_044972 [Papaver somniferum]|uniref:Uncharacterized protein n=1 Tax=Papaver somniferum TaxID=3469 RepID=A0A4Y7LAB6_PAPSO|nr:hypothetical protein C5167_044972 [Papaver somniferum]
MSVTYYISDDVRVSTECNHFPSQIFSVKPSKGPEEGVKATLNLEPVAWRFKENDKADEEEKKATKKDDSNEE